MSTISYLVKIPQWCPWKRNVQRLPDSSGKPTAALRQAQGDRQGSEDLQRIAGTEVEGCTNAHSQK